MEDQTRLLIAMLCIAAIGLLAKAVGWPVP